MTHVQCKSYRDIVTNDNVIGKCLALADKVVLIMCGHTCSFACFGGLGSYSVTHSVMHSCHVLISFVAFLVLISVDFTIDLS